MLMTVSLARLDSRLTLPFYLPFALLCLLPRLPLLHRQELIEEGKKHVATWEEDNAVVENERIRLADVLSLASSTRFFLESRENEKESLDVAAESVEKGVPLLLGLWARLPFHQTLVDAENRLRHRLELIKEELQQRAEEERVWEVEQAEAEKKTEFERKIFEVEEKRRLKQAARRRF